MIDNEKIQYRINAGNIHSFVYSEHADCYMIEEKGKKV